jgi:hypothetical protein
MFSSRTNWERSPNPLASALAERRAKGLDTIDLTESNPTRCGLSPDAAALNAALSGPLIDVYDPRPRGLPVARSAIRAYYADGGAAIDEQQIVVTTSTSESYAFAFQLLADPGDEILAPQPSYPLLPYLADLHDVSLTSYPLIYDHGWVIDFEALQAAITPRTKAIVAVSPNNPSGSYLAGEERERMVRIAVEHGLALIVDEVFRDYAWAVNGSRPQSTATEEECLTLTMNGLSKISALPQMKLGWTVVSGSRKIREEALARLEVIGDTYLSVATPVQHAAAALLGLRHEVQAKILSRVRENVRVLDELMTGSACDRLQAKAGWYAMVRVPRTRGDEQWALDLLAAGVHVHPGYLFDAPQEGLLVLSLLAPQAEFREGVKRLVNLAG